MAPHPGAARPLGPLNPFEAYLLVVAVLQGGTVIPGVARPTTIQEALPPVLRVVWGLLLVAGGLLSLAGLVWPGSPWTAIEIKRVGLYGAGIASAAYAVALFSAGAVGVVAGLAAAGFTAACVARIWQIGRALRVARAYLGSAGRRPQRK